MLITTPENRKSCKLSTACLWLNKQRFTFKFKRARKSLIRAVWLWFDQIWLTVAKQSSRLHNLIQMLQRPHRCLDVSDIMCLRLRPAHFIPVRRAQKKTQTPEHHNTWNCLSDPITPGTKLNEEIGFYRISLPKKKKIQSSSILNLINLSMMQLFSDRALELIALVLKRLWCRWIIEKVLSSPKDEMTHFLDQSETNQHSFNQSALVA